VYRHRPITDKKTKEVSILLDHDHKLGLDSAGSGDGGNPASLVIRLAA
jgi:hypothetical protein